MEASSSLPSMEFRPRLKMTVASRASGDLCFLEFLDAFVRKTMISHALVEIGPVSAALGSVIW
ncbi:hypothetical protein U1Q18_017866, partial [Sarracenia purpurea var. burkii]